MEVPRTLDPNTARLLPWLIAVAFFMQSLDATILNVALPAMAHDLGQNPLRMQSVVIAYILTVAALIPTSGWIADRFGSRRVFCIAIALFTLGSLFCALSESLSALIISRVIQGFGGALMVPVGRLTILRAFPRSELVRVMSFVTVPALIGPLAGPTVGGWLVEYLSWHWIFLINLPIGVIGCVLSARLMPDFRRERRQRFDGAGFVLFSAATLSLSLALEGLGDMHLSGPRVVVLLVTGLGCLAAYWLRALRIDEPLFSPTLFRIRTFTVGIIGNLFARLGNGALPFLIPLLLQVGLGFSPSRAGLSMIPMTLAAMLAKPLVRPLLDRVGYRRTLVANTLLLGALIMSLGLLGPATPYWLLLLQLSALGLVNSLQFTAMNTITLIDLEGDNAASGNSLLAVVMQLSIGMGVASSAALLGGFSAGGEGDVRTVLDAFAATFLAVGAMAMLASMIFFQLHPGDGRTRPRRRR